MTQTNIPADVRERIIAAAVELYDQAGRENLPTVDAVRRAARADMNTTSAVMREWRRAQTAQAAPVAVTVPEVVTQANTAALATLWQQAQELANESLRAAQAAWETERVELDTMRQELADAYETQATELDQVRAELDRAHQDADQARAAVTEAQQATQAVTAQLDQVRAELAKVQAKAEAADEQRKAAATEAHKMAERLTATQAERDQAREEAGSARERAAELAGQLTAHQEQAAALLARLAPAETKTPRAKK